MRHNFAWLSSERVFGVPYMQQTTVRYMADDSQSLFKTENEATGLRQAGVLNMYRQIHG